MISKNLFKKDFAPKCTTFNNDNFFPNTLDLYILASLCSFKFTNDRVQINVLHFAVRNAFKRTKGQ